MSRLGSAPFSKSITAVNSANVTVGNHSGVATGTDLSEIEYSIDIENEVTLTKAQTFTKSKKGTDGEDGATGRKVKELIVYYPVTFANSAISAPDTPTSGTYNFGTNAIASLASGWQLTQPTLTLGTTYWTSEALATESSTANVSNSLTWSTPSNSHSPQNDIDFIFQRSASQPSTPSQTNWPTIPSGWETDIGQVAAGSNPIWVSKGVSTFSTSGGFTFKYTWETPVRIEGSDGTDGDDGTNNATLTLFKRSSSGSSGPAVPNGDVTYVFANSSVTNTADLDGWTLNGVPSGSAQYLWSCSAVASSNTTTDVVATGEWSTPQVLSEAQQPRTDHKPVFYTLWSPGSTVPSVPTATSYNFTTKAFTGLTTNWSTSTPAQPPFVICVLEIKEATFGGTQTITAGPVTPVGGKFDRIDISDFEIDFDGTNNIRARIGATALGTTSYQTGSVPAGLKNSGITINANGALAGAGGGQVSKAGIGLGNLSNNAQIRADLVGAPSGVLNSSVSINANGTLSGAGSGQVSKAGIGLGNLSNNAQVRADLVGAPGGILNSGISLSASGVLSGGVASSQVHIGSIAAPPVTTSGDVDT